MLDLPLEAVKQLSRKTLRDEDCDEDCNCPCEIDHAAHKEIARLKEELRGAFADTDAITKSRDRDYKLYTEACVMLNNATTLAGHLRKALIRARDQMDLTATIMDSDTHAKGARDEANKALDIATDFPFEDGVKT